MTCAGIALAGVLPAMVAFGQVLAPGAQTKPGQAPPSLCSPATVAPLAAPEPFVFPGLGPEADQRALRGKRDRGRFEPLAQKLAAIAATLPATDRLPFDDTSMARLVRGFNDPATPAGVRVTVAKALKNLGHPAALPLLIHALGWRPPGGKGEAGPNVCATAYATLFERTGQTFATQAAWRSWLATISPPPK